MQTKQKNSAMNDSVTLKLGTEVFWLFVLNNSVITMFTVRAEGESELQNNLFRYV